MKLIFFYTCFLCCIVLNTAYAQKPSLDIKAIRHFPELRPMLPKSISNDGAYVMYTVSIPDTGSVLYIRSTKGDFVKEVKGLPQYYSNASFTEDSRYAVFKLPGDSLCLLDLKSRKETYLPNCSSYQMPDEGSGQWLAYRQKDKTLVLYNLFSNTKKYFSAVSDYQFDLTGSTLLLTVKPDSSVTEELQWVNLKDDQTKLIWQGTGSGGFTFTPSGNRLAFTVHHDETTSIWYYQNNTGAANELVNTSTDGMQKGWDIENTDLEFSPNGQQLFFKIFDKPTEQKTDAQASSVNVWSYKDEFLQPAQQEALKYSANLSYQAVFSFREEKVMRLQQEGERFLELNTGGNDDLMLTEDITNPNWARWLPQQWSDFFLIDTKDAKRKCIGRQFKFYSCQFSPGGKYVYWYDNAEGNYYVYDIQTGLTRNISSKVPTTLYWEWHEWTNRKAISYGTAVWLKDDKGLLVYDRYDIWLLDPAGKTPPLNITNGYGRKHKVILRYVNTLGEDNDNPPPVTRETELLLCALDEQNKDNGFFKKRLTVQGDPVKLVMKPAVYYFPDYRVVLFNQYRPSFRNAKNADVYLLKEGTTTGYPNFVITKDFKTFSPVSHLEPQKPYNWMTSELIHWQTFKGKQGEGILYKPENFDPHKKYPVIFYFYEQLSAGLNLYIQPELSAGPMNIPSYVSQGYLVCCPDIHYTVGDPGVSAYDYVVSAARMLSQKPYVDAKKMGIQGHSWGGYEVNYIVTRTGLFAAAASAAGPADFVSSSGIPMVGGMDWHGMVEYGQNRMGATIWENTPAYIRNSPVFHADKVTTPLLIMHNKKDPIVDWSTNGLQFFTHLRRLGKKVWMLQYDNGKHILTDEKDKLDYTQRLNQFFNYYLKDSLPPVWMTKGVPARLKGIDSGLEYDTSGNKP